MRVVVKVENLRKSFDGREVLRGVNFEAEEGKITVLMGRSGCGKTVLIKHMIGLLRPDSGKIYVMGKEITGMKEKELMSTLKNVGVLFQSAALFDSMNVEENVAFPLVEHTHLTQAEVKKRVREVLKIVGLEGAEKKCPPELSGGMKRRVGLARAIVFNPSIVIFDEPTSGIDPVTATSIEDLILETQKQLEVSFLVVTHDIKSALKLAHKIYVMREGKIAWSGATETIWEAQDEETKKFIERLR